MRVVAFALVLSACGGDFRSAPLAGGTGGAQESGGDSGFGAAGGSLAGSGGGGSASAGAGGLVTSGGSGGVGNGGSSDRCSDGEAMACNGINACVGAKVCVEGIWTACECPGSGGEAGDIGSGGGPDSGGAGGTGAIGGAVGSTGGSGAGSVGTGGETATGGTAGGVSCPPIDQFDPNAKECPSPCDGFVPYPIEAGKCLYAVRVTIASWTENFRCTESYHDCAVVGDPDSDYVAYMPPDALFEEHDFNGSFCERVCESP